ncbi:MAG TPA: deoxyribodipyrimidine photo-lyase [Buchnera sp. (in: enterobacteria)]|nr:deoxyribodipyrimidine photo-lyase [Buchnera sp. (in: enterobacteria)]
MKTHLVWFRNDLRVHDNTALYNACLDEQVNVLSIFIATPKQWKKHCMSFKQSAFIYENLLMLKKEIQKIGIPLYFYKSTDFLSSAQYLINFCKIKKVNSMFYNYQYEINEKNRDNYIITELKKIHISTFGFHDNLLVEPNQIKNKNKTTYKVFSFFKNKIINKLQTDTIKLFSIPRPRILLNRGNRIINFGYSYDSFNKSLFPVGENNALNKLTSFIDNQVNHYWEKRNFPALNYTSFLSVYLSVGVLSPRQCINSLLKNVSLKYMRNNIQSIWLNELIWREFYKHVLIGYPKICTYKSFFSWENHIKWNVNQKKWIAWITGTTGYPMVGRCWNTTIKYIRMDE